MTGFFCLSTYLLEIYHCSLCLFVGVLEEAEFYNIAALIQLLKDRIKHHHQKNQVRTPFPPAGKHPNTSGPYLHDAKQV